MERDGTGTGTSYGTGTGISYGTYGVGVEIPPGSGSQRFHPIYIVNIGFNSSYK